MNKEIITEIEKRVIRLDGRRPTPTSETDTGMFDIEGRLVPIGLYTLEMRRVLVPITAPEK